MSCYLWNQEPCNHCTFSVCSSCWSVSLRCVLMCSYDCHVEIQTCQSAIMFTKRRRIFKLAQVIGLFVVFFKELWLSGWESYRLSGRSLFLCMFHRLIAVYSGLYCLSHKEFLQCRRPGFHPWLEMTPWKRIWLLTPVLLPGEIHGQRSLVNYNPWATIQRVRHDWAIEQLTLSLQNIFKFPYNTKMLYFCKFSLFFA